MNSYQEKVKSQIEQYRQVANIHDLPDIFHYWSNRYLRPKLISVMGVDSVVDFYVKPFAEVCNTEHGRLLSVGAGDCGLEINVAAKLRKQGVEAFELHCLELSPVLLERAETSIQKSGLGAHIKLHEVDINRWQPNDSYIGVMANHSLHHFVKLESIFSVIDQCLSPGGVFVTNDMIGRNGHMRWPEVLEFVEHIWRFMPDHYKFNRQLDRFEPEFINWDCSNEGFEGVRAQDILPLLVDRFSFSAFLAFGGVTDIFIDRAFGHNLDPASNVDKAFVDFLELLNERLIDGNIIKPTTMFAVMRKGACSLPVVWKNWTPDYCRRDVSAVPPAPTF